MRRAAIGLTACVLASACASTPAPALPSPAGRTAVALPIAPAASHVAPHAAPAPLAPAVCHVSSTLLEGIRGEHGAPLRASRGGEPFAILSAARTDSMTLTFFEETDDVRLEAQTDEHASFGVWTQQDEFLYEPTQASLVDGFFVAYPEAEPRWHYAGNELFRAELPVPAGLRLASGAAALTATRSCEQMTTAARWARVRSVKYAQPILGSALVESGETERIAGGASVPLALEPHGAVVAYLEPEEAISVMLVPRAKNAMRPPADAVNIAWDAGTSLVMGWVPRASLTGKGGFFRGRSSSTSCGPFLVNGTRDVHECTGDVALFARTKAGVDAEPVGMLHAGARYTGDGDDAGFTVAKPDAAGFSFGLVDGADLVVRSADTSRCPLTTVKLGP